MLPHNVTVFSSILPGIYKVSPKTLQIANLHPFTPFIWDTMHIQIQLKLTDELKVHQFNVIILLLYQ